VIVLDIYGSAREKKEEIVGAQNLALDLVEAIKHKNTKAQKQQKIIYIPTLGECEKYLREKAERGEVIILMGAGDVFRIGENLVRE